MQVPNGDVPITPLTDKSIVISEHDDILFLNQMTQNNFQLKDKMIQGPMKPSIHQKLNQEFFEMNQKKNQLRESYQQMALQECSFRPKISQRSVEMKSQDNKQPRYMSPRKQSQEFIQVQQSPKQKAKYNKQNKENVWARLTSNKESKTKLVITSYRDKKKESVSPKIDREKANEIVNRLYNQSFEAKRFSQPKEVSQVTIRGSYNEKFVLHYFVREFYKALTSARCWTLTDIASNYLCDFQFNIGSDLCLITIQEVSMIMDSLGFVPQENDRLLFEIFSILQCPKDFPLILSRNLLCFLLSLQGYQSEMEKIPPYENQYHIPFPIQQKNEIISFINGNLKIYDEEMLIKKYENLNLNHLAYKKNECPKQNEQYTIQTSKETQVLAQQYRQRIASQISLKNITLRDYDLVYSQHKQKLAEETTDINAKICTFNPIINQTKVQSRYLKPKEQVNSLHEKKQDITHKFSPSINQFIPQADQGVPSDHSQIVDRMIKGRVQKQLREAIIKQGTCNLKKRQKLEESLYEQEINKVKQPTMFIDVIIDNNEKQRIIVHEGDTADKLGEQFIIKHRINSNQTQQLINLIQQQLETNDK